LHLTVSLPERTTDTIVSQKEQDGSQDFTYFTTYHSLTS